MCTTSGHRGGKLRITQAYIALLSIPESGSAARTISVARIGKCEILMFNGSPARSGDAPLLWMELFDHHAKMALDSFSFREIEEAMAGFDVLVARASDANVAGEPQSDDPQV